MGPVANEEFVKNVVRGGELLAAGKGIEAKEYLERAHRIQPKNEKGQNLLGLTYFNLGLALAQVGRFEEARAHFVEAGSETMAEKMGRALTGEAEAVAALPQGQT